MAEPDRSVNGSVIAYLTSQYPATSHTFISREIAALRDLGVSVQTFSIRPPTQSEMQDELLRSEAEKTFTVLRQPLIRFIAAQASVLLTSPGGYFRTLGRALTHRPRGLRGWAMSLVYFAESLLLARELKRRGVTRLHNHFANAGAIVGYLAASLLDLPWSFTMHGISETDYPAGLLLGRKIEAAEFVACVSYFGRAQAMRLVAPDHWSKLHVVRCGVPLDRLPKFPAKRGQKRLICVGRLSPEKGQAGLLEAFATIARNVPEAELLFVGDGPQAEDLSSRSQSLRIGDKVTFAGRLGEQETLEQIAASDILVLPSFMEGLPIVLMEAMAVGTAVIASRVAGIPELVDDNKSGLLFTPSKWDELAACMQRLLKDDELRKSLAQNAKATVTAEFDIRDSANQLRALFGGSGTK
jgi:colanic acid/amylovoran biosynthesis glycosyltransferase